MFENEPDQKYRLIKEEIAAQDDLDDNKPKAVEQHPEQFSFMNRTSLKKKPKMDPTVEVKSVNLFDNLAEHMQAMEIADDGEGKSSKDVHQRKLTTDEKNENRGVSIVKRKPTLEKKLHKVEFTDFDLLMVLGRGAFGKVFLAKLPLNDQLYAIKAIRKDILIEMDQVESTLLEKDIMFECDHPFLVGMEFLFQNDLRLYFVMPFVRGGELYKIYEQQKRFSEEVVRFYAAQLAIAIGYLHSKGIAHRDLKLENILVD